MLGVVHEIQQANNLLSRPAEPSIAAPGTQILEGMAMKFIWNNSIARSRNEIALWGGSILELNYRLPGYLQLARWADIHVTNGHQIVSVRDVFTAATNDLRAGLVTLLHWAAKLNQPWLLQQFLDDPACAIDAKCSQGKTALDWAIAAGAKESIEILRKHPKQQAIDAAAKKEAEAKARIEAEAKAKNHALAAAKAKAEENARFAAEKAKAEAAAKAEVELLAHARQAIPNDFQCPITTQIMYEPMMAADGESYEKEYIEAWLANRNTSPLTNELLAHKHLTPNKNLKRAIDELLDKYPLLKESGDVYLANSVMQQAIKAVERGDAKELARLVTIHFGLVTENLHKDIALPKPKVDAQSSTSSCSEQIEPEVTAIHPEPAPLYLLNLICEKGDVACLEVAIKRMGANFKNIVLKQNHNDPDGLLQLLAKRQASAALDILTAALGYTSEDYLRLMRSHLNVDGMRGLWLDYYLKAHQKSPEVVLEKMITAVTAEEAVATLKTTSIRLNSSVVYSLAARCIKRGLLTELQALVTLGLSLQTVDAKGNNLLHLAAEHNQKAIALWLLANGCSEKAVNSKGQRPRQVAAVNQHYDLSDSLIRQHQAQKLSFFVQPLQAKVHELEQSVALSQSALAVIQPLQAKIAELEKSLALSQSTLFKLESSMLGASAVATVSESEASSTLPNLPTPHL